MNGCNSLLSSQVWCSVLVVEPMLDEDAEMSMSSVLSSLMITLFGGKRRSAQEYIRLLRSCGYGGGWRDLGLSIYKLVVAYT